MLKTNRKATSSCVLLHVHRRLPKQNNQKICPATTRDPCTDTPVSFALLDGPTDRSYDGSSGLGHGIREEIESSLRLRR